MSIEKLPQDVMLPFDQPAIISGIPQRLATYLRELVSELERTRLFSIHQRVNLLLDLQDSTIAYLGTKNAAGDYANGTWRINGESETEFLIQLKVAGTWVTKYTVTSDGLIVGSGMGLQSVTVTDDYVVGDDIYGILVDTSAKAIDITLPALTGQRSLVVSVDGSNPATIVGTINGDTNPLLYDGETMDLTDMGTEWRV